VRLTPLLLAALLAAGCGSDTISSAATAGGRVYAVTSGQSNQLLVFTQQNTVSAGTTTPSVVVSLPVPGPVACRLDRSRDRLYVACDGGAAAGTGRLLIYDNVSQLSGSSQPNFNLSLSGGTPEDMTYDETRDIVYIGDANGAIGRLNSASSATSATTITFAQPVQGSGPQNLNSVLIDPATDRLLTAVGPVNTPVLLLPVFNNASTNLTPSGTLNPAGITNAGDLHFENTRLLVLDGAKGTANTRVLRYEPPFGGISPSLTVTVPNATCLQYDAGQNALYVGLSTNTISVYANFSTLNNQATAVTRTLGTSASVADIAVDNSRN